ncbi:DUF4382 domain-containing protein [Psychromonas sp. MB-3u-54]|uniref:DUF4382 domain-containing protein n=1 Tax=Psychromonas sp. MB-3u-54 TaxID=2058319 RepID=UPI0012FF4C2D|nr:DUF4382 domain-containing protein [Psychromonas sp. MB-3u-54]
MNTLSKTLLASAVILGLTACGGSDSAPATTKVDIGVSDAAIDEVSQVVVHYTKIALLPQTEGQDPIVLDFEEEVQVVNLLDFQGSKKFLLLDDQEVLVGDYKACLFVQDGNTANPSLSSHVLLADTTTLQALNVQGNGACPQGVGKEEGTGVLFFNNAFTIDAENNNYVIEFDLRGLKEDPKKADDYIIKRTWVDIINTNTTGNLAGSISENAFLACEATSPNTEDNGFAHSVYLYPGATTEGEIGDVDGELTGTVAPISTSLLTEDTTGGETVYTYEFGFLEPGDYRVAYTCMANDDASDTEEPDVLSADTFTFYSKPDVTAVVKGETAVVTDIDVVAP